MVNIPSPAIAVVGRHNSGKTTLIEQLIRELTARGLDVGSIKHHSHKGFDIDYPGKDSYRHRAAGATETVIAAPGQVAVIKTVEGEVECAELVQAMPGHDIIVVEGYRKSGLPTIELMRSGNQADARAAQVLLDAARQGLPLGTDFTQLGRAAEGRTDASFAADVREKMPTADTVAFVSDMTEVREAAELLGVPVFPLGDVVPLADFLEAHYARPRVTVVIQAGGESRRMGRSKATVPFDGRPLICRLVERLSPVADELIITTNEAPNLAFLHEMYPQLNIRLVPDECEGRGALPGLYTALLNARNPYVACVACDMVFASGSLVVAEALAMHESGADAVVPQNKHGFEPFHALYRRDTCLPAVKRGVECGEKRAQSFFDDPDVNVLPFTQDQVLLAEPRGGCFINVNTPEELARIENWYLGE